MSKRMKNDSISIRTRPNPQCVLCGRNGETLYDGLKDQLFGAPGEWRLVKCADDDCGVIWLNPVAIDEDLHLAYRQYYTHEARAGLFDRIKDQAITRGYQLVNLPFLLLFGLFGPRRRLHTMFLDDLEPGRLFDVGCGDGEFLDRMRRRGWAGAGIDFDGAAVVSGKEKYGLDLVCGDFQSATIKGKGYDAVTMSHVIEHVTDPDATLKRCWELLRKGGRLTVTTPNARSLGHLEFARNWRGLEPPRHLQIFSPQSLARCAERAGFTVEFAGSTAANAAYIIAASHSIARAPKDAGGAWELGPVIKGALAQYREHLMLKKNPEAGEEAILIATK